MKKLLAKGFSVAVLAILTGGIPVWAQQPSVGTPAPKTPPATPAPDSAVTPTPPAAPAAPVPAPAMETATPAATKVNINTADETALTSVKGIGKSRAKAIIAYREKNGAFTTVDDLTKVKGIKEKSLNKFKDQLTVE
jgi:competence protein ComEA